MAMSTPVALVVSAVRSAVAPHGGAFNALQAHELAAPLIHALLARSGLAPGAVDAVVLGNALGAGGNPARMAALAAGLPDACAAYSVDTQCCSGLDALTMAVGLLASGQASVVLAGGVEAWSRSPIRQVRPLRQGDAAVAYERPAFAPDPARDPDLLVSAARHAIAKGWTRALQDRYAVESHARAVQGQAALADEIVAVQGLAADALPRSLSAARAARFPAALSLTALGSEWQDAGAGGPDCALSPLTISSKADGAAFVLLASEAACQRFKLHGKAAWLSAVSIGCAPETPLLGAQIAARLAMTRAGLHGTDALAAIELHDAFAVQGLDFCQALGLDSARINRRGGGLARGHPIGASGAIAFVRLFADLVRDEAPGAKGLAAVAAAGGLGAAVVLERL